MFNGLEMKISGFSIKALEASKLRAQGPKIRV